MNTNIFAQNKALIVIAAVLVIVFFVFIFLMFSVVKSNTTSNIPPGATPIPVTKDTKVDYSNIDKLIPGTSTLEDTEKLNGAPSRTSKVGDKTYLYYQTPIRGIENKVLIRYGVVIYAFENVYAEYRGSYESYTSPLGSPDVTMYANAGFDYPWHVFLKSGVAVQSSGTYITGILYFVPQSKASFVTNIANDFGLSEKEPEDFEFNSAP